MRLGGLDEMATGRIKKDMISDIRDWKKDAPLKFNQIYEAPMNNPTDSASFNQHSSSSLC
jgi:hypothetical protein